MAVESLFDFLDGSLKILKPALEHIDSIGMDNFGVVGCMTGGVVLTICALLNISSEISRTKKH